MQAQGWGRIIMMTSLAAHVPNTITGDCVHLGPVREQLETSKYPPLHGLCERDGRLRS
jgi:hypothetical protein